MLENIDWKLVAAGVSLVLAIASYFPYWFEILKGNTKPHIYTWIIWAITQGTAAAALIYGNGQLGATMLIAGMFGIASVILLSFKYGTRNITKSDTAVLVAAIAAIFVWWQLDNPVLAVLMVAGIDALGYLPTYRKLYQEPWSESLFAWVLINTGYVFSLLALTEYNLLTLPYICTIFAANLVLITLALMRRRVIPKPTPAL